MDKPKLYFVNGSAAAIDGEHMFKNVMCGAGPDVSYWKTVADVIELFPGEDGVYYLKDEGSHSDYGESYLVASKGVAAGGAKGQGGSIGVILSPIRSYNEYVENIKAIKDLLEQRLDFRLYRSLLRLAFIGVCGEMEGYLSSTIISLVQGVSSVILTLRDFDGLPSFRDDEFIWRDLIVDKINDAYLFQHICRRGSKERRIYEQLLGEELLIPQGLIDSIVWRNKLAHKVSFFSKSIYPTKENVLEFIAQTDELVNRIDRHINQYKSCWLEDFR